MSDTIIQYKTNNDGTVGQLLGSGNVSPEIKAAAATVASGLQQQTKGSPLTLYRDAITAVLADAGEVVYLSRIGSYYLSKLPKHPADMLVEYPSPALLSLLQEHNIVDVEDARDVIARAANAGFLGDTAEDLLFLQTQQAEQQAQETVK
jgi:hypothetical protein